MILKWFDGIAEYSPAAISLKDLEGRYQFVNQRFVEWYGPMAAPAEAPCCGREARILLVEDDPEVGFLIVQMLRHLGHRVVEARNGRQALALLDAEPGFDILLSDVVLAGHMNGVEVAATARRGAPNLKIVYLSGYTDDELTRLGAGGEDAGFLAKPFQFAALSEVLDAALSPNDAPAAA